MLIDVGRMYQHNLTRSDIMNKELQNDYEYHQNAKWDFAEQLKREHHDPFAGEEMSEEEKREFIEQEKKEMEMDNE